MISVRSHVDVGKAVAKLNGDAIAFGGLDVGRTAGDLGRFVVNLPAEVLQMSAGDDGFPAGHASTVVEDANDGAAVGLNSGTALRKRQVLHSVRVEAIEVNRTASVADVAHVVTDNRTVGTAIEELAVTSREGPSINADNVGGMTAAAMMSGGRHPSGLAGHPARMLLATEGGKWAGLVRSGNQPPI